MDIRCEACWRAFGRQDYGFRVGARPITHAGVQPFAARVLLDPIEGDGRGPKAPPLDHLDVGADGDVRPGAPQQQRAVVGGQGRDRQVHNLFERAGAVMVVGCGADLAARPAPPGPSRIG
jgi:hypothetical protein